MTCVNVEEYRASDSVDPAFRVVGNERVSPFPGSVILSEAHFCINGEDAMIENFEFRDGVGPPLLLNESEEEAKNRRWRVVHCVKCKSWLGDARSSKDDGNVVEIRLFKCFVENTSGPAKLFDKYELESILCGSVIDAVTTRECFRFELAHSSAEDDSVCPVLCLTALSFDSWVQTDFHPNAVPAVKFLYWDCRSPANEEKTKKWIAKQQSEYIVFPSKDACLKVADTLIKSNAWLPHSARVAPDGSRVGFLLW